MRKKGSQSIEKFPPLNWSSGEIIPSINSQLIDHNKNFNGYFHGNNVML